MVDDLVCISNCGLDSILMNAYINSKSNMKKLQFGSSKCHKMHVCAKTCYCPKLYVDNWEAKMVEDVFTGEKVLIDELNGEHTMEESRTEKYLGDLISNDGKHDKNIKARKDKGQGIVDQIMSILESTVCGPFQFEVALILRASFLLNGILTNSEVWYGLKTADFENLEQIDERLLRRILEVGSGCPREMLYLETGSIPIRFIITYRRLMFLHYILSEDQDSLIYRCFTAQRKSPSRNDLSVTVEKDFEYLRITQTYEEIKSMKKEKFGNMVKKLIE